MDALSIAAGSLRNAALRQSVSAHNVANVSTPGFRASRVHQVESPGGGAQSTATPQDSSSGPIQVTGRPIDLAIQGPGYFQFETAAGTRYSRAGALSIDGNGFLVDPSGHKIAPGIQVPAGADGVAISGDGVVSVVDPTGATQAIGQIELAQIPNPGGLLAQGGNLYSLSPAAGTPVVGSAGEAGFGMVVSGALEGSNTNLITEMTTQLLARTEFQVQTNVFRTQNEMLGEAIDLLAP